MRQLVARLEMSASSIRRLISLGLFPRPVYPIEGMPRWTGNQVETYLAALEMGIVRQVPDEKKPVPKKGSQDQ